MGKKKNLKSHNEAVVEQAERTVSNELEKMMDRLDRDGIDNRPAAALIIIMLGAYLLKSGNAPMFDDSVRCLTEIYPEFFDIQDDDSSDNTFH